MVKLKIEGCLLTPLKKISKIGGSVFHALKSSDIGYNGFGEVYFSSTEPGVTSDWKLHKRMTLNLVVPVGKIKFVLRDQRDESSTFGNSMQVLLGSNDYSRLTIPPNIWVAFQGVAEHESVLANIADLEHDPSETIRKPLDTFDFNGEVIR